MARSAFASPFRYLSGLLSSPRAALSRSDNPQTPAQRDDPGYTPSPEMRAGSYDSVDYGKGKRKATEEHHSGPTTKKRALSRDRDAFIPYPNEMDLDQSPSVFSKGNRTKAELDRTLMPPPATPRNRTTPVLTRRVDTNAVQDSHMTIYEDDSISFVSSALARRKGDSLDADAMEEARRHAAAVTLPANSGLWSQTERELFFHLAYRGFEALLPQNWMIDFDTLPISVFAHENSVDPPLIQNIRDNQFRASHALRRLFEAGHDIRDRTHVSPGISRERILEQSVKRYLYWALTDVGLRPASKTNYIPVHVVVARKKGRSTLQTLEEIANKLQRLSQRHQRAHNIHPSIETSSPGLCNPAETRVVDDDAVSPTLIGFVIISSVLVVVTLSSSPTSTSESQTKQTASPLFTGHSLRGDGVKTSVNPDRLRIIAELDFSQRDQDVWNALGVAIVAMQVRREALKANHGFTPDELAGIDWDVMSEEADSRHQNQDEFEGTSTLSRLQSVDDDPDL
ncbi:uncharacterized protein Z520_11853 [Fonsecaea multimorphosa CBS 102226]|uniref:Uncharacterized protein n=1 Tax=Fonsecaea multimorphosa CBS 102226 TaxID=1442371 RepID=A0A0D2JPK1_9EURO|nr:uncharacterized protein Z520_11853 [Fonsecaea multimorphosa CBS 102226]KIX92379.1 hypothetical protein Z520_11853 [Fonsecaea multimorphosa CBS 102226]OAL17751.1 hypothetical protein AYO22_11279 [Fonsecaea multimorphosa]